MSQLTLYLDSATQALVEQGAKSAGLSKSRWVADLVNKHARSEWSEELSNLAGSFPDFSLRAAESETRDVERISF